MQVTIRPQWIEQTPWGSTSPNRRYWGEYYRNPDPLPGDLRLLAMEIDAFPTPGMYNWRSYVIALDDHGNETPLHPYHDWCGHNATLRMAKNTATTWAHRLAVALMQGTPP